MPELRGRRILVVGASSGIGAAVARLAGERGARVAVTARRADRLEELASSLPRGVAIPADVREEVEVDRMVDAAVDHLDGLDAVVYATGVSPLLPLRDATRDDWRHVLETNVVGAALVGAAVAPHLVERGGRLVLLSSKSVRQPFPALGLYSISKIALDGLIRTLPVELPGLLVSRVVVGNTRETEFAAAWDEQALEAALERWTASGVLGSTATMLPEEVAETVLHVIESPAHIDDVAVLDHEPPAAG